MKPPYMFLMFSLHFAIRSSFNIREINTREVSRFFGHNSLPRRSSEPILRHNLPIVTPDLPLATRRQNSIVKPKYLNSIFYITFIEHFRSKKLRSIA